MKRSRLFSCITALLLILFAEAAYSQGNFLYQSDIRQVTKAGFYKILLDPSLVAKCKEDISDLRLLDTGRRQIPYILQNDLPEIRSNNFTELPLLSVTRESDKQTHIVIGNAQRKTISELLLVIKNTDADRSVTISGSDDNKQWFVIKENILLVNLPAPGKDRFIQYLNFPTSAYAFFKIIVNGENLLPVNIVKAGVYDGIQRAGSYSVLPTPAIRQIDSADKHSYVQLIFNEKYRVNKIDLQVKGPQYYRRSLRLLRSRDGDEMGEKDVVSSDSPANYSLDVKTDSITAIIENDDNLPLIIESAKAYQLNKYLWAYLEPQQNYQLVFGNTEASAPKYDLAFFKDKITNPEGSFNSGTVVKNKRATQAPVAAKRNRDTIVLWTIIVLVLALLLFLTFRMTKEIRKKESNPS